MKKLAPFLLPLTLCMACAATPEESADDLSPEESAEEAAQSAEEGTDDDSEVIASTSEALTRCGANLVSQCSGGRNPGCKVSVYYKHCTSGRGSIRVKANIRFYPDGGCVTVGPNEKRLIHVFGVPPGVFRRIDRC